MSQKLPALTLIYGDEPLFVQEAVDTFRQQCAEAKYTREVFDAEATFDWSELTVAEQSLSLFSHHRFLEFRLPRLKLSEAGKKILIHYAQHPAPDTVVLLWAQAFDPSQSKTKWFQALDKHASCRPYRRLAAGQFAPWLKTRAQQMGLSVAADALAYCAQCLEGNPLAAKQVLEKCEVLHKTSPIDLEAMRAAVHHGMRYDAFQVVDAAFAGQLSHIPRMMGALQAEGIAPLLLLGALMKNWREWLEVSQAVSQGIPVDAALRQARVWARRQPLMKQTLARHTYQEGLAFLRMAAHIERAFKRGVSPWAPLTALLLAIAGEKSLYTAWEKSV